MKCVVVGIGHVAVERYLPVLAAEPDIELACCSRNVDSARRAAERFGAEILIDLDEIARWQPDLVFVVSPDSTHVEIVERLIGLGVPRIFVEKPLASADGQSRISHRDLDDGVRLERAAAERGIAIAVGYNYRHFATVSRARDEVAQRGWARPSGVVAWTHYACLSHVIDLIGLFAGELVRVSALRSDDERGDGKFHVEDRVVALVAASGTTGVLRASAAQPWGDSLFELTVSYPEGSIRISDLDGSLELFDQATARRERFEPAYERRRSDGYEASFIASIQAYLATVRAGTEAPSTIADGVRELRFHAAVASSIASGASVRLGHD